MSIWAFCRNPCSLQSVFSHAPPAKHGLQATRIHLLVGLRQRFIGLLMRNGKSVTPFAGALRTHNALFPDQLTCLGGTNNDENFRTRIYAELRGFAFYPRQPAFIRVLFTYQFRRDNVEMQHSISSGRRVLLTIIQWIELPLIAVVTGMAIFAERLDPSNLTIGLLALLVPSALRLVVTGRIVAPTFALWPLLLLLGLCALTVYVTPTWTHTWPEMVRLLAGVALCLALINWMNPIGAVFGYWDERRYGLPWRFVVGTLAFVGSSVGLTAVGLLALGTTNKFLPTIPWTRIEQIEQLTTYGAFNPNRVAGAAVLAAPLVFALFLGPLMPRYRTAGVWVGWFFHESNKPGVGHIFGDGPAPHTVTRALCWPLVALYSPFCSAWVVEAGLSWLYCCSSVSAFSLKHAPMGGTSSLSATIIPA